ncbi:Uncharacterized protein QTN25_003538 [Entamoeba marina]
MNFFNWLSRQPPQKPSPQPKQPTRQNLQPSTQIRNRTDKILTLIYLDLKDVDTINLYTELKPMQSIDFIIVSNVHPTLIRDDAVVKKIQLSHPHVFPPIPSFTKELPQILIFSKFRIAESVPFEKMPTVFARKSEIDCQIVRFNTSEIHKDSSIALVVFNLDNKVNENAFEIEDYHDVSISFLRHYELELIGKTQALMNIPYSGKSSILFCGNFHELAVVEIPPTLGVVDKTKLESVIQKMINGDAIIQQLEEQQIPVKPALGLIYKETKDYKNVSTAIVAEVVAIAISDYICSSVRLLPYKELAKHYIGEAIEGINMAYRNEPQTAAFLNRVNKSIRENGIDEDIEEIGVHFAMFLVAIQRWLKLKLKSHVLISLLSGKESKTITENDFDLNCENSFRDLASSKLPNNLSHLGSMVSKTTDPIFSINKTQHILSLTNHLSNDVSSKSPFADLQCLEYSSLPSNSIPIPSNTEGIFVRFAIYPKIE